MESIRAAAVQLNHVPGDKDANLGKIEAFTARAAAEGVELLAFPEMCITGYWHVRKLAHDQVEALAEPVPDGPSTRRLVELAATHGLTLGAGLIERADDGTLYNTYVVALPDGRTVRHRKLHCFISAHMASGNEYTVFDLPSGVRVGVLICYDNNLGRERADHGAPGRRGPPRPPPDRRVQLAEPAHHGPGGRGPVGQPGEGPGGHRGRAAGAQGSRVAHALAPDPRPRQRGVRRLRNGVGPDDDEVRTGNAMIIDPYGRILAETWKAAEDMVIADLDLSLLEQSTGRRWISTRRPELYGELAVSTGLEVDTRQVRFDQKGV